MFRKGILLLSKHAPPQEVLEMQPEPSSNRKRLGVSHGAKTNHFIHYIRCLLHVLKELNLRNKYIVMDNCAIHKDNAIKQLVEEDGHHLLFLPPYSPFLNPIEECWSKIKHQVGKRPLTDTEDLIQRIKAASKTVTMEDCQG